MDAWRLPCVFRNVLPPEAFEEVSPVVHSVSLGEGLLCIEPFQLVFQILKLSRFVVLGRNNNNNKEIKFICSQIV